MIKITEKIILQLETRLKLEMDIHLSLKIGREACYDEVQKFLKNIAAVKKKQ